MKKTAVLVYDSFCNFEFSVALEILALSEKKVTIFGKTKAPVKSEEGLTVLPDDIIDNVNETDINPPAELGRLADASGDKQSTRIIPRYNRCRLGKSHKIQRRYIHG